MQRILAVLIILVAACKAATAPTGLDPTILFHNAGQYAPVLNADLTFIWWDQSGQVQQTVIPWGGTACIKFTATTPADSVRFEFFMGDTTGASGAWYKQWSPWFDPATGITRDTAAYPHGAEYWWFDWSKNPYAGTLLSAPC